MTDWYSWSNFKPYQENVRKDLRSDITMSILDRILQDLKLIKEELGIGTKEEEE